MEVVTNPDTNYSRTHFNLHLDDSIEEISSVAYGIRVQIQGQKFCHNFAINGCGKPTIAGNPDGFLFYDTVSVQN